MITSWLRGVGVAVVMIATGAAVADASGPSRGRPARLASQVTRAGEATGQPVPPPRDPGSVSVSDMSSIGATPDALAQSLAGEGVAVSNVTYAGSGRAAGRFTNGAASIGFESGVVLGTGKVESYSTDAACSQGVEGPNTCSEQGGASNANSTDFGLSGDPDLDALVAPSTTHDAAVLQFDFVPKQSRIQINYVFSSEEYDDFVGAGFNDPFGFFVNGNNCALVPGTGQPVSVDTINNGSDVNPDVPASNPQYFRDNVRPSPSIDSQMDGLTTVLTCTAAVTPGQQNHMKLAIADTNDGKIDSAVFIQATSLTSGIAASGGQTFAGAAPLAVDGPVATFTDTTPGTSAGDYAATISWGDGSTSAGSVSGSDGQFAVAGSHTYTQPGSYVLAVTITQQSNPSNSATTSDAVSVTSAQHPGTPVITGSSPGVGPGGSFSFTAQVNPNGSATQVHFEYGIDPKYIDAPNATLVFDHRSSDFSVGSGFGAKPVSFSGSGLIPNAVYHFRIVASNASGTTATPDSSFTTAMDPPPPPPVLGKSVNLFPASGTVFVRGPHGASLNTAALFKSGALFSKGHGFIPLTEARQVPVGSQLDTRRGTVRLVSATAHAGRLHSGKFGGRALFSAKQARRGLHKGLVTLKLLENLFPGAPSYSSCRSHKATAGPQVRAARVNRQILQTLHSSERGGRFRTSGRFSAGTVRGTVWTIEDRCDGTWTRVRRGILTVRDFVRRKTITLRAGHSYLARRRR